MKISIVLSNLSSILVFGLFYLFSLCTNLKIDTQVWFFMFMLLVILLVFEDIKTDNN